jgi:hypothetical protein
MSTITHRHSHDHVNTMHKSSPASSNPDLVVLNPPHKTRTALQIAASGLIMYACWSAYMSVLPIIENMETYSEHPGERLSQLPTWIFFVGLFLGVVPGVYVFMTLKKHFEGCAHHSF